MPGETGWDIGVLGWFPTQHPTIDKGKASDFTNPSLLTFAGKPKFAEGADVGFAVGRHNQLRFYYTEAKAAGNTTVNHDVTLFDQTYNAGDLVSTNYRVQDFKLVFEFLTWPFPVESRKFRLRTLWGVRYLTVRSIFDAPLKPITDSSGNPLVDASGQPITFRTEGSKNVIYPSLGIGVQQYIGRYVRLEAAGAGFAWPHRSVVWDADGSVNVRAGHFELRVGVKALHFKTSPKSDFFNTGTLAAPFVGLRWYSD
ncbi:MAG TPA: hypothetical protein VGF59_26065 [Bryobacteraceae bacterium]|jgi:hypothetical protein